MTSETSGAAARGTELIMAFMVCTARMAGAKREMDRAVLDFEILAAKAFPEQMLELARGEIAKRFPGLEVLRVPGVTLGGIETAEAGVQPPAEPAEAAAAAS